MKKELEIIQNNLNEKFAQNSKLNIDFSNLFRIIETKAINLQQLRQELNDGMESNFYLLQEKSELEKDIDILKEKNSKSKNEVDKLLNDNKKLEKICREEELLIKNLESEKRKFLSLNEETRYENSNLNYTIKHRDENINYNQKQLEESNSKFFNLSQSVRELEKNLVRLKLVNENQEALNKNDIRIRSVKEKEIDELEKEIRNIEKQIKPALKELDIMTLEKEKSYEDNSKAYNEIDRLKNHIYIMNDGNRGVKFYLNYFYLKIADRLNNMEQQAHLIKNHLKRRENFISKLKNSKECIENSLNEFDVDELRLKEAVRK